MLNRWTVSLMLLLCITSGVAQMPDGWMPPERVAQLSFDHEFARIGGRELRWGGTAGVEWLRKSPRLAIRGLESAYPQQLFATRWISTWRDGVGVNILLLQLGIKYTGLGASMNGWYIELGSGIAVSDGTTFDMNSQFNFASYAGFGFWVRDLPNWMLGTRITHISNGGTKPPNRSMNLLQVIIGYSF
ncbi:MAG: hypothetical protein KatS3mg015_0877 [Fimbriimonadales bacterium]|nr:MAG: hypothetical protein KatS3mg015_0877 [Fimbriimonadales bacterium]